MVLALVSLACSLPGRTSTQPPTEIPMSQGDAQLLEDQLKETLASGAASGQVTVTITQQQLNSYLVSKLAEMQQDEPRLSDPVVVLTGGNMEVYGKVTQSGITLDAKSVLQPQVTEGSPTLDVISVDLGGIPVPDTMTNRLETLVNNALNDYLAQNGGRFTITTLSIDEGQMTVTGTAQ